MKPHTTAFLASALLLLNCINAGSYHRMRKDIKYGPWVTEVSETGATVLWITEATTIDAVEMDGREYFQAIDEAPHHGTMHRVRIDSLQPGTEYVYRLVGRKITEQSDTTDPETLPREFSNYFSFKTMDSHSDSCRFALICDMHADKEMACLLGADIRNRDFDFIVLGGDMVSRETCPDDFLTSAITPLSEAAEWIPIFFTMGEQEREGCCPLCLGELFPSESGAFWQSLRHGPVALLILDSEADEEQLQTQATWLKEAVCDSLFASAPFKVAVMHRPALEGPLTPILAEAGLDLMICGHKHKSKEYASGECGNPFPVIVNSCEERLDFRAGAGKIAISFNNAAGQTVHRYELRRK